MSEATNNNQMEQEGKMVSEPAIAYRTPMHQVHMAFDVPQSFDEELFRHMMVVYAKDIIEQVDEEELPNPMSLEEAMAMGCVDLETFSKEMHEYIDQLCDEYDIK